MTVTGSLPLQAAHLAPQLTFDYTFTVPAPVEQVAAFHNHPRALTLLTPPPLRVELLDINQPTGVPTSQQEIVEGTRLRFNLWFGPFPIFWEAVHSAVGPGGFTDTQVSGPLAFWQHTHTFLARPDGKTQVHEHIRARYATGLRGLWGRLLFSVPGLQFLFAFRKKATIENIGVRHGK